MTGVSGLETELAPKRLEILKALVPSLRRVWAVHHVDDPSAAAAARGAQEAAPRLGVQVIARPVRTARELAETLKSIPHGDGLLAPYDTILDVPGQMLVASLWARLPVIYPAAFWARATLPGVAESGLAGWRHMDLTTKRKEFRPHGWSRRSCGVKRLATFPSKTSLTFA